MKKYENPTLEILHTVCDVVAVSTPLNEDPKEGDGYGSDIFSE